MEAAAEEEKATKNFTEDPAILDKYKAAAQIASQVLLRIVSEKIEAGADIATVCEFGDSLIEEELKKVYASKKTKKVERGLAFPTCLSVNYVCGNFSPLKEDSVELKAGDLVKVDLGCHIDGYVAQTAHSLVVPEKIGAETKVSSRAADVLLAAHTAHEAAIRTIRAGNTNDQVTDAIAQACEEFKCNPLEGVLSHKLKKHVIDGNDTIINKRCAAEFLQDVETYTFKKGDVFSLDVTVSTGEGKTKEFQDCRTTVFKRDLENTYILKSKTARAFLSQVNQRFPTLPFSIRSFEDATGAKLGVKQCLEHDLIVGYPVVVEKTGELVAQFKSTVCVLESGEMQVLANGGSQVWNKANISSEYKVTNEELLKTLAVSIDKKSQKKQKGKDKKENKETAE